MNVIFALIDACLVWLGMFVVVSLLGKPWVNRAKS